MKAENGKTKWSLLPWRELEQVAKVFTFGAKKYAPNDWKKVEDINDVYFSALMRHQISGAETDGESGESHLAHAAASLLIMMWQQNEQKELDKKVGVVLTEQENETIKICSFCLKPTTRYWLHDGFFLCPDCSDLRTTTRAKKIPVMRGST